MLLYLLDFIWAETMKRTWRSTVIFEICKWLRVCRTPKMIVSCLYLTIYVVYCNVFVSYNTISYIAVYPIAPQIVIWSPPSGLLFAHCDQHNANERRRLLPRPWRLSVILQSKDASEKLGLFLKNSDSSLLRPIPLPIPLTHSQPRSNPLNPDPP